MPADIRIAVDGQPNGRFVLRAAAIIVRRSADDPGDARLLMVTSDRCDYLYSVGGAVEFGETTREAAAREVREELGVDLPVGDLAAIEQSFFHGDDGHDWHQVVFNYWVDVPADFEPICASTDSHGESERLCWVGADDLAKGVRLFPALFQDALAGRWAGIRQFVERDGRYQ